MKPVFYNSKGQPVFDAHNPEGWSEEQLRAEYEKFQREVDPELPFDEWKECVMAIPIDK